MPHTPAEHLRTPKLLPDRLIHPGHTATRRLPDISPTGTICIQLQNLRSTNYYRHKHNASDRNPDKAEDCSMITRNCYVVNLPAEAPSTVYMQLHPTT